MRKLLTSRLFRCVVCLSLVCCMIVNVVSIRARASALPEVVGVVTEIIPFNPGAGAAAGGAAAVGTQVFGYVLGGLGLIVPTVQVIELMNQYSEFTGELETSIYYYPDGSWSYGVDMSFVERVRAFLFDRGYIISSPNFVFASEQTLVLAGTEFVLSANSPFAVVGLYWDAGSSASKTFFYAFAPSLSSFTYNDSNKDCKEYGYYSAGNFFSFLNDYNPSDMSDCPIVKVPDLTSATISDFFGGEIPTELVTTVEGVTLGQVAPLEVTMPEAYPEWHTNARPVTNPDTQEEITVLPIPLDPNIQELPDTLTQPDIWQGSIADPMPDTGTDTDPEGGTSGDAPSTDIGDYQIDLKKFFPFCIPFDLYDFFTCLNADPVAPVIEWVIPLPGGGTYPLEIDLSAFDGVAKLLRRLQLLLFCVGLAFKTRDLIKG